jgi:hypothetical protein
MFTQTKPTFETCGVIHLLFDEPEIKLSADGLGRIKMSRSVKFSLLALRGYLILMFILLGYHVMQMAGVFGPHIAK